VALDVDATCVAGEWIRHAPHRSSLRGRSAEPTDGRWQHALIARGLYLADEAYLDHVVYAMLAADWTPTGAQ
jgi:hypothetical protein